MAKIDDLINKIDNPELRLLIEQELSKIQRQRKFGLVFEEHLPECTPLFDIPVKRGSTVALKVGKISENYVVTKIEGNTAVCEKLDGTHTIESYNLDELVVVAQFGEPIYPFLQKIDSVQNAPESDLWHTLIEADNYHALQLLVYLYAGQVDCIYIDPPYNTGARDWKYNNDYVDSSDSYRHSKWLSMMQKRLQLAKKLLNPKDSVLIVTIDEKEYLHLGCLLEQMFPEARMQMISTIIRPEGTSRANEFSRTNEFIFFVQIGNIALTTSCSDMFEIEDIDFPETHIEWRNFRRRGAKNLRDKQHPNQFYPFFISKETGKIVDIGESLPYGIDKSTVSIPDGTYALFPISPDGVETMWNKKLEVVRQMFIDGYIRVTNGMNPKTAGIEYLSSGTVNDIEEGRVIITGRGEQNEVVGYYVSGQKTNLPKTVWYLKSHNAQTNGSILIKRILDEKRFDFPKSLYAVHDAIRFFVANKPNALIIDFFAGSGTTLHAVNLLNAEDGGHRRCIMVTNNEVSDAESKSLTKQGYKPGDKEWEKLGIARYVTWPRTVCSIEGHDVNGQPLKGNYIGSEIPMADGFKANAIFFKLGFLDKTNVSLGREFSRMLSLLWMKAGAHGVCPSVSETSVPDMLVYPENRFAVLNTESAFSTFAENVNSHHEIETVFIITDSENAYKDMIKHLDAKRTFQLYRDYLDNFRINQTR